MSISRNSRHKRRATGGRMPIHQKKRKFEMGRVPTQTKLGAKKITLVRGRGGNLKHRAWRLDHGTFSWGSESCSRKTRVIDTVYNATNNELVRTKTLVKNSIVYVDATPFRQWYFQHYNVELNKKKAAEKTEERKQSKHLQQKIKNRGKGRTIEAHLDSQFNSGRLLACITSRPGQSGRLDGYILEGKELDFYLKKLDKKKK
jgi:small subunit ribosomal protein S8e